MTSQPGASGRNADGIMSAVVEVLENITGDWETEFAGEIGPDTLLIADLGFESIDVVHLIVALEERFQRTDLPFEDLLMEDGRYVPDLKVGQVADFLGSQLSAGEAV